MTHQDDISPFIDPPALSQLTLNPEEEYLKNQHQSSQPLQKLKSSKQLSSSQPLQEEVRVLKNHNLDIESLAVKINETIFGYEKYREKFKDQGIDETYIVNELKEIIDKAQTASPDGTLIVDYKTKLKALRQITDMTKHTGHSGNLAMMIKTLLTAQGLKTEDAKVNFNFTKLLYNN